MLAPLKDRSVIEREGAPDSAREQALQAENAALRQSLRQTRQAQKRSATISTREIIALTNENNRLAERNQQLQARIDELESGLAITVLSQHLMQLQVENDALIAAAQRVWFLDRTLCAAHHECERLARERDAALSCLQLRANTPTD